MASEKAFVITVLVNEDDEWALTPNNVYSDLTDAVGYNGRMWIGAVAEYVAPRPERVFVGKIPTIKEIRSMMQYGLAESKDIVDAAKLLGKFRFGGGIMVEYRGNHQGNDHFAITDNR